MVKKMKKEEDEEFGSLAHHLAKQPASAASGGKRKQDDGASTRVPSSKGPGSVSTAGGNKRRKGKFTSCYICGAEPKGTKENGNKVVMAGKDGMGNPVLDACWACMTSGCAYYPGKTWAEVCQECDEDANKKSELVAGGKVAELVAAQDLNPEVKKRQNVHHDTATGVEVMVEVGVLTESELKQLMERVSDADVELGATLKTANIVSAPMIDHLGDMANLYVISLRNLPCHEIHSLRRMKVFSSSLLNLQECLVEAARQLGEAQPKNLFQHRQAQEKDKLPSGFKDTGGTRHLQDIQSLISKVAKKTEKAVAKAAAAKAAAAAEDEEDTGEDDRQSRSEQESDASESEVEVRKVAPAHAVKQEAGSKRPNSGAAAAKKRSKTKEPSDDEDFEGGSQEITGEFLKCVKKLGSVPQCFYQLKPEEIMKKKQKIGRSLDAVGRILESMNKKKQQEAKILEKILDLSQHAYDVAVSPGLLKMKKKDRLAALTALEKAGVAFPLEIMAVHTLSMVADQFNQAAQSPISLQTAHTIRDLFAVWKWGSTSEGDQLTYDDWSVACPTFPSLFAALSDQQKLALDLDTQEAEAEYEALCACYMEALGCDEFFNVMGNVEKTHVVENIKMISEAIYTSVSNVTLRDDVPQMVADCCGTAKTGFGCLLAMLVPNAGYAGTSPEQVIAVRNEQDAATFLGTLKLHLTGPWVTHVDEIVKVGSKKLIETQKWADDMLAKLKEEGNASTPDQPVPKTLHEVARGLGEMKPLSRSGQLKPLELECKNQAVAATNRVLSLVDASSIQSADVRMIQVVLDCFSKEAGIVELKKKLYTWANSKAATLEARDVEEILLQACQDLEEGRDALATLTALFQTKKVTATSQNKNLVAGLLHDFLMQWASGEERLSKITPQEVELMKKLVRVAFDQDQAKEEMELVVQHGLHSQALLNKIADFVAIGPTPEKRADNDKLKQNAMLLAAFQAHKAYASSLGKIEHLRKNRKDMAEDSQEKLSTDPLVSCKFIVPLEVMLTKKSILEGCDHAVAVFAGKFGEVKNYLEALTKGQEYGAWKEGVGGDAALEDLIKAAKETVGTINSSDLKKQCAEIDQEAAIAEHFFTRIPKLKAFDVAAAELKSLISDFRQCGQKATELKIECMLMIALMCKTAKGKELIRGELALLSAKGKEENIHPVLLKAARARLDS